VLWSVDDALSCCKCCNGLNIWHRTKLGFGRRERLKAKDLDELIAKLETTMALRFRPAPKHWRGKARLVANSRSLVGRMRRSLITCRLNQLATQQTAKQGDDGLLGAYQPLAEVARATDIRPIWRARTAEELQQAEVARATDIRPVWRARTAEELQQALDTAQSAMFAALASTDPQQRLVAAKLFLRTRQARERGW
jgi:hypothetical protein